MGTDSLPHRYCGYVSQVLLIFLTDTAYSHRTDDMPDSTETGDLLHSHCISSRVLWVCLTGTADLPNRHCGYASRVLMIFLTGTVGMPQGY